MPCMEGETLSDLMDYLYRGQVSLTPRRLGSLIAWGKTLSIKGILELEANSYTTAADPPMAHYSKPETRENLTPITPWSSFAPWQNTTVVPPPPASTGLCLLGKKTQHKVHSQKYIDANSAFHLEMPFFRRTRYCIQ